MNWRQHYPFGSNYLEVPGGHRLHYVDQGGVDQGGVDQGGVDQGGVDQGGQPTIVMSHGNPTWSFYYRRLIQHWSAHYRVVAVDHLGCGLSDKPQQYDYCLRQHSQNLLQLIERLELEEIVIVGHDWGGAIGLNALRLQPDRFSRILMFNTGAFPPPRIPWRIAACRIPLLGPLGVRGANLFAEAALRMTMVHPHKLSPSERAGMIAPYGNWHDRVAIQRFVDDIPFTKRHPTYEELEQLAAALPNVKLPTMLFWGMRDWCFDARCLQRLESIWPHAEVVRCEDAGHWVVEDAPERILQATTAFLRPLHAVE